MKVRTCELVSSANEHCKCGRNAHQLRPKLFAVRPEHKALKRLATPVVRWTDNKATASPRDASGATMDGEEGVTSGARATCVRSGTVGEGAESKKKLHTAGQMLLFCNFDSPWRNSTRIVAGKCCCTSTYSNNIYVAIFSTQKCAHNGVRLERSSDAKCRR